VILLGEPPQGGEHGVQYDGANDDRIDGLSLDLS
jgi:hypothetical protein